MRSTTTDSGRIFRSSSRVRAAVALALVIAIVASLGTGVVEAQGRRGRDFQRWPVITIDGEDYRWEGAPDGPSGETDVPGHSWLQPSPGFLIAKHFNTGPFGAQSWWSSDAPDGALLYLAFVRIDEWTPGKAEKYARRGFVHYHELLNVVTGEPHPTKVGWFKHLALRNFTLDGGPRPDLAHDVRRGVDREFIANWMTPYEP